jgi:cell division protein FtsJ
MPRSKSSSQWLQRHVSDPFVKQAQREGYRSRSAYKLIELNDKDRLIRPGMRILDLGSAPGGWSQVAGQLVGAKGRVLATDILPMDPLKNVDFIQGDFTEEAVVGRLLEWLDGGRFDLIVSDIAAVPFAALQDPIAVAQRVLELVNVARAAARRCGREDHAPAPPLTLSTTLTAAASLHSLDMAERGSLGHEGSDGSASGERMTRAGYVWQASGENIAAGQPDAESAVAAWLGSPGHCATLMEPRFTETGIAFALAPGKNPPVYWTQVFATPR